MTDQTIEQLAELPELESVKLRSDQAALVMVGFAGVIGVQVALIAFLAVFAWPYMETMGRVLCAIIALLVAFIILRALGGYHSMWTDPTGLTLKGVLRHRFIPWIDIERATLRKTRAGYNVLSLWTGRGRVKFNPSGISGSSRSSDALSASVFQHLRRLGRIEGIEISDSMKRIWEPVPEDVPRELDWTSKSSKGDMVGFAIVTLMLGGGAIGLWFAFPLKFPAFLFPLSLTLASAAMIYWLFIPEAFRKAQIVSVREGYLEANTSLGKAYVPWSEVVGHQFLQGALAFYYGEKRRELRVPFIKGNKDSEDLILAIIRKLRTAGLPQAVAIPDIISRDRSSLYDSSLSSHERSSKLAAFINTLDPQTKKRIMPLWRMHIGATMLGFLCGAASMFTFPLERLAKSLHSTSDTIYFIIPLDMGFAIPMMLGFALVLALVSDKIARKRVGSYLEVWNELQKVASGGKAGIVSQRIVIGVVAAAVVLAFLYVDGYARVTEQGIAINRFFGVGEEFHHWKSVTSIEIEESRGSERHCSSYVYRVRFSDGRSWKADEGSVGPLTRRDLEPAIEHIAIESRVTPTYTYK